MPIVSRAEAAVCVGAEVKAEKYCAKPTRNATNVASVAYPRVTGCTLRGANGMTQLVSSDPPATR
jgi:hypothetical protein